jgi:hypothetical protein
MRKRAAHVRTSLVIELEMAYRSFVGRWLAVLCAALAHPDEDGSAPSGRGTISLSNITPLHR